MKETKHIGTDRAWIKGRYYLAHAERWTIIHLTREPMTRPHLAAGKMVLQK